MYIVHENKDYVGIPSFLMSIPLHQIKKDFTTSTKYLRKSTTTTTTYHVTGDFSILQLRDLSIHR